MKKVLLTESEYRMVCSILNEKNEEIDEKKQYVIDNIVNSYNSKDTIYSGLFCNFLRYLGVSIYNDKTYSVYYDDYHYYYSKSFVLNRTTSINGNVIRIVDECYTRKFMEFYDYKKLVKSYREKFKLGNFFKKVSEEYYKDDNILITDLRKNCYGVMKSSIKYEIYLEKIPSEIVDVFYEKIKDIESSYDNALNSIDFSKIRIPDRDWEKMIAYKKKQSDEKILVNSIKDETKLLNRFLIASIIGWKTFANYAANKLGLDKYKLEAYKNEFISSGKVPEKYLEEFNSSNEGKYAFDYTHTDNKIKNAILKNENIVDIKEIDVNRNYRNLDPDRRNGCCWTISHAYELTLSNGNVVSFQYDNHTNEGGGTYGYEWGHSSISVGGTKEFDSQESIIRLINALVEEGMK